MSLATTACCVLAALVAVRAEEGTVAAGYHERVGVPEAARIQQHEDRLQLMSARIAGGLGSYLGEHPFMAGLVITLTTGQTSVCGGTLLSATRALTAAHCWYDGYYQAQRILLVLGSAQLFSGGARVFATGIATQPSYNPYGVVNDLAMLGIPAVTISNNVKPILLPAASQADSTFAGYSAEAIGYGKTVDSAAITTSQSLRDVYVSVMTNAACAAVYGASVTGSILCTSGAGGLGPCGGDSGGPLILRYYSGGEDLLIGVISFGSTSGCTAGQPSGYQRVTHHLDWIRSYL